MADTISLDAAATSSSNAVAVMEPPRVKPVFVPGPLGVVIT
jgi:hypothetical protein